MLRTLSALWLVSCGRDPEPAPVPTETDPFVEPTLPDPTGTEPLPVCSPSLTIDPSEVALGPSALVVLTASGGTGAYRFALQDPALGQVHPTSGAYLAADTEGAVDTVLLTDDGCRGEATASVTVGAPFSVLPTTATVLPGTVFDFEVTGGSGSATCAAIDLASGGSLTAACRYTAGSAAGSDRMSVTDDLTGDTVDVTVVVDPDATFEVDGSDTWFVPLDATFAPTTRGGSGVLDLVVLSGPVTSLGASLRADAPGTATVRVEDRFAGFEHTVDVEVVAPFVPPSDWYGQRSSQGEAVEAGDLNGDGYADAVLGFLEINGDAWYSGGVAVWAGGPGGLGPEPVWTALGTSSEEYLGRSVVLADLDGDGAKELIAGADGGDLTSVNIGLVRVWRGIPGGFFEDTPWTTLRGLYGSDRFGSALAACDFDGDGYTDVAVGAYAHEDRSADVYPSDTGAVMIYRGGPGGLPDEASVFRYGQLLDGLGGWFGQTSSNAGLLGMDAGDLDGDGDCELAVASYNEQIFGAVEAYGFVVVFDGLPSAEGTLSATPSRSYANLIDTDASFGRDLAIGDYDGDGLGDLAIGAYLWNGAAGSSTGGIFVYRGASYDGRAGTDPYEPADADWFATGDGSSDNLGIDVAFGDVDVDGLDDLVAGELRGELLKGTSGVGRVLAWSGATLDAAAPGHDGSLDPLIFEAAGVALDDYFAQAVAPLGDTDGDGTADWLVLAGRTDALGLDVGSVHALRGDGTTIDLTLPGEPGGHEHGRGLALFDVDADGTSELMVGSPQDGDLVLGTFVGSVWSFEGLGGAAFEPLAVEHAGTHADLGSGDRIGFAMARTDFDGDGRQDLAIAARVDSRPTTFGATYVNPADCPGSISSTGSVVIFLGTPTGLGTTPAFVAYGYDVSANVRTLAGGFDHDGDGRQDLAFAGRDWSTGGGVGLLHGQAADPAGTTVLCTYDSWLGFTSGDQLGQSVAAVPDLDGDGCDELAVGAPLDDAAFPTQGVVRVLWGAGAACTPGDRMTALAPGVANTQAGQGLASGGDADGDGLADLLVGATDWRVGTTEFGMTWLVPGSWILSLPTQSVAPGVLPDAASTVLQPIVPPLGSWGVQGPTGSARFGQTVAFVEDPLVPSRSAIAIGLPDGDVGGVTFAGGVRLHRYAADVGGGVPGIAPVPFAVAGGETHAPGGVFGDTLVADQIDGNGVLLVGAPLSSVGGTQAGAAYVLPLR